MKTNRKIRIVCCQLLLVLGLLLVTQATVKADQFDEGVAAYQAGNYQKALELFKLVAAEEGDPSSQGILGVMYANGQGVPQDYTEAVKWYRKSAVQGSGASQHNLGFLYDKGLGVPQDYTEALKWYRKSAAQGNAIAQNKLGIMYDNGFGVPQNYTEAIKWYRKSAEQGHGSSQYNLGLMFFKGQGVPQDYVQAHKWFNLSASRSQGKTHEEAVLLRKRIQKTMTPPQLAKAQKLAREWKPKTWIELSQQN
jgi:hypothetical protein